MRSLLPLFLFALIGCADTSAPTHESIDSNADKTKGAKKPPCGCCSSEDSESMKSLTSNGDVKLTKVKAAEFEKIVASHKGKVVAIDVWADFCAPCKKAFPHIVKLHQEHAKDGLVCISLSKDHDPDLEDNYDGALKFLQAQNATLANYILWDTEEAKDDLEKRISHVRIPVFHVFDKQGMLFKSWEGAIKHEEIDQTIEELLKGK